MGSEWVEERTNKQTASTATSKPSVYRLGLKPRCRAPSCQRPSISLPTNCMMNLQRLKCLQTVYLSDAKSPLHSYQILSLEIPHRARRKTFLEPSNSLAHHTRSLFIRGVPPIMVISALWTQLIHIVCLETFKKTPPACSTDCTTDFFLFYV